MRNARACTSRKCGRACKDAHTLCTGQRERDRKRERGIEKERGRERVRKREGERLNFNARVRTPSSPVRERGRYI